MGGKAARRGAKNNATEGGYNVKGKTGAKAKNDEYMSVLGKRIAEMGRVTGYQGKGRAGRPVIKERVQGGKNKLGKRGEKNRTPGLGTGTEGRQYYP